ncbi:MAG: hypothetical protein LUQ11_14585 [Methylococcaceae bacterium]|nr:hypothetical protein [Methylococcaceae bacterium]
MTHRVLGGTYFFTVNLAKRKHNDLLIRHVETLHEACRYVQQRYPFVIEAWWCCRNICTASGHCRKAMMIFHCAGVC